MLGKERGTVAEDLYSGGRTTFFGIILVAVGIVFFLSAMGAFRDDFYLFGDTIDMLFAFFFLLVGLVYVFTEAGKPGKPKFKAQFKEQKLSPLQ